MYFLTNVLPLGRVPLGTLSYFHSTKLPVGSLVTIQIGKKQTPGIVSGQQSIADLKLHVRKHGVTLKKIHSVVHEGLLRKEVVDSIRKQADFFLTRPGNLLSQFFDATLPRPARQIDTKKNYHELQSLHGPVADRLVYYKTLIRETLARKESIMFVFPSKKDQESFARELMIGIEHRVVVVNGDTKNKVRGEMLEKDSIVYFSTPQFFLNMPHDTGVCVVERATDVYPRLHASDVATQTFVKNVCRDLQIKNIIADDVIGISDAHKVREHTLTPLFSSSLALPFLFSVVDLKKDIGPKNSNIFFSAQLLDSLRDTLLKNKTALLVVNRTGYAPITICRDCGSLVRCRTCNSSLTLFSQSDSTRIFICRSCNIKTSSNTLCNICRSWRLETLGIGTEQVREFIAKEFPTIPISIFDSKHIKTASGVKKFLVSIDQPGPRIVIATEMLLYHCDRQFDQVGIISLDNMLSIPHFSTPERIAYLALRFGALSRSTPILQTRLIEEPVFQALQKRHLGDFYKAELVDRKTFAYPPFGVMIKIRPSDQRNSVATMGQLRQRLEKWYPVATKDGLIIKTPGTSWPDQELAEAIQEFRALVLVSIDTDGA